MSVPAGATASACATAGWPRTVAGQPARETVPSSPATHAWGDPAVVGRCGVPALAPTTDQCLSVDGVDWVVRTLSDGASFTTYGTEPALEVLVPDAYAPEPLLLPAFTALARTLPRNGRACVG